jgi:hypothetical protein
MKILAADPAHHQERGRCHWVKHLSFRPAKGVCLAKGDTEQPDSMAMDISSSGNGYGSFAAGSRSLIGIGNTTALGYVHTTSEMVGAVGSFMVNGKVRWSSFTSSI